jgi:PAS domain S-box-containing protein
MNPKVHNKLRARENKQGTRASQTNTARAYFDDLVRHIPEALIAIDNQHLVIGWNAAAERIYGRNEQEVMGKQLDDFLQTRYGQQSDEQEVIRISGETGIWSGEVTQLRKDGTRIFISSSVSIVKNEQGVSIGFISINRDISSQKQIEETLSISEARFRFLFESIPQGVVHQDANGIVIDANPAAQEILGFTLNQLKGRTSLDSRWKSIHEDGSEFPGETHPAMIALSTGKNVSNVVMGVYNPCTDKYRWLNINAIPRFHPGEEVPYEVYTAFENITTRKRAEDELRESESNLKSFINNSPDTIYAVDLGSHTSRFLNREEFLGYNKHELESENSIMSAVHPEDHAIVADQWNEMTITGENQLTPIQYRAQNKNGGWEWIQQRISILLRTEIGAPQTLLITLSVITERKLAGESLLQSEQKYAKIFHTSPMLMAITELGSSIYTEVNDVFLRTLGFTREEVVGHTTGELNFFVRPEQAITALQIMQTHGTLSDFEVEVRAKSGMIHHGLFGAEFIELAGKRYLLTVMNDITERKKIEEQLIASEARNRAIIDSVPDLLFEMDETGVFLGYSALDNDKLYARPEAFLGKNIFDVLPKPMALKTMNKIKEALIQKKLIKFEYDLNMDGHQRFYEDRIVPLTENSILSVIRDITESKIEKRNLLHRTEDLQLIKTLNDATNHGEDLDSILQTLVRETRGVFNCQDVSIYLMSPDSQYIEMQSTTISQKLFDKVDKLIGRSIPNIRILLSESSFFKELLSVEQGTLISGKKPLERWLSVFAETTCPSESLRLISNNIVPHILKIMNIRSVILIPLISSGQAIGLMDITSRELLTDETHQRMRGLSNQVTAVLLRKQVEKKSMIQLQRLGALREIDRVISSSMDMSLALDTLLIQALSQLHVDAASVLLLDAFGQTFEYAAGKGFHSLSICQSRVPIGEGLAGRAGLERKTIHVPNLGTKGGQFQFRKFLIEENFVEYFGIPLIAKGVLKGVLEIFNRTSLNPDLDWLNYLESLGGQAAIAIDNVQLFEGMQQSNQELIAAYDATIAGWSHAMDLRDKETEGHTQRVTNLTVRLAGRMGVNQKEMVQVHRGALLHDIGKLGIPDNILLKPGKLTDEEWVIMCQHPVHAFDMLMPIAYLRPAMDIPYCHHEKWDGSGYPRGLKGEQIPLVARIFSIVDIWDALRSDRPYRASWTVEKVREHIIELSGKHLDPRVVEAFISYLDESPDFK